MTAPATETVAQVIARVAAEYESESPPRSERSLLADALDVETAAHAAARAEAVAGHRKAAGYKRELVELREVLRRRNEEINELRRQIGKLRSAERRRLHGCMPRKVRFRTEEGARREASRLGHVNDVYRCEFCAGWHMTTLRCAA